MTLSSHLAALYLRDLTRLKQEVEKFPDDGSVWRKPDAIPNSAGNLVLHIEGNLREYIGRQLGGLPYERQRDLEFSSSDIPLSELVARLDGLLQTIPKAVAGLSEAKLAETYPENVLGLPIPVAQFVIHLDIHLNYHMGQIDYLRRILTNTGTVTFAKLHPWTEVK